MVKILCCQNKLRMYKNILKNAYNQQRINYIDLKISIQEKWKEVKFVDIIIQNNEFNLHVCCNEYQVPNAQKYFDIVKVHKRIGIPTEQDLKNSFSDSDKSFVRVARELNEWNVGGFVLERVNQFYNNQEEYINTCNNKSNLSIVIPLEIPISRIIEFYGVRCVL